MMIKGSDKITEAHQEFIDMILDHINKVGIEEFNSERYAKFFKECHPTVGGENKVATIDLSGEWPKLSGIDNKGITLMFESGESLTLDFEVLKGRK